MDPGPSKSGPGLLKRTRSRGVETSEDIVHTRSFPFGQSCLEAFVGQFGFNRADRAITYFSVVHI